MTDSKIIYIAGFGIIAALVLATLAYGAIEGYDFGGSDDSGGEIAPGDDGDEYEPWWNGIFGDYELPGETESLLFAVQAAIGAIIIGYFIGRSVAKKDRF